MADSESFPHHQHYLASATDTDTPTTGSFSQLLFCNDLDGDNCDDVVLGGPDDIDQTFHYSSIGKPPMMLCFGGYIENEGDQVVLFDSSIGNINEATKVVTTAQRPGVSTCSGNSSASSGATANHRVVANAAAAAAEPNRKRDGSNQEAVQRPSTSVKATQASQRTSNKKTKMENPAATGNTRGRREKLGERITALQQLVSPFGKTDTASVLHEAMGYIRFLHDQVQVLCSPYLQHQLEVEEDGEGEETRQDLRSRGLCLVPVECTVHVSSTNGADYWSPAAAINDSSTAIKYQAVNQN